MTGTDGLLYLRETRWLNESGIQTIMINAEGLPAGIYLLKLEANGKGNVAAIVKVRKE